MDETARWALPLLASGQAQKEISHNEALTIIDRLLHLSVISRGLATPPDNPATGDMYIIGAGSTGAWAGAAGRIASFEGPGWTIWTARRGCLAWIADEQQCAVYSGDQWSMGGWPARGLVIDGRLVLAAVPTAIAAPTGGTSIDSECRTALTDLLTALRSQNVIL
jgi:hypothetical protein